MLNILIYVLAFIIGFTLTLGIIGEVSLVAGSKKVLVP